jgi:hypothetical protein
MELNFIGIISASATFFGVWIGHVSVRKIEYKAHTIWVPSLAALILGLLMELGALLIDNHYLAAALGILGVTALWDALEFWRQQQRVLKGHAPANPDNPRHARILQISEKATTIDWLNRNPAGRQLSPDELQSIQENMQ